MRTAVRDSVPQCLLDQALRLNYTAVVRVTRVRFEEVLAMELFSASNLPADPAVWPRYRKRVLTSAIKIDGPFAVQTSEGTLSCADGYLALDARGYPYPIASDEFGLIYEASE